MSGDWDHRDDDVAHAATDQQAQHGVDLDLASLAAQVQHDALSEAPHATPPPDPVSVGAQDLDTPWSPGSDDGSQAMLDQLVDQALGTDAWAGPSDVQAGATTDDPPPAAHDDPRAADPIDDLIAQALGHAPPPPPEPEPPPDHANSQQAAADHAVSVPADDIMDQVQGSDTPAHAEAVPEAGPTHDDPASHDPPPHDPSSSAADEPAPWDQLDQLISDALGGTGTGQPWPDPPAECTDQAVAGPTPDQGSALPTIDELISLALGHDAPPAAETVAHTEAEHTPALPPALDEQAEPWSIAETADPPPDHAATALADAEHEPHVLHDAALPPAPEAHVVPQPGDDPPEPPAGGHDEAWPHPDHDLSWDVATSPTASAPEDEDAAPAMVHDATHAEAADEPRATAGIDDPALHAPGHDAAPADATDDPAILAALARGRHQHLPPFEPLRAAELEIARDQIAALNSALGISIPPDRALAAPWTGMHGTATHRRNTSEGWRRDGHGFLRDYLDTFGEDRALLDGGLVVTAALAAAWGLDAALIGDRLVHHHLNNGPLVVLLPETLHRRESAKIHRHATVLQPGRVSSSSASATGGGETAG